MLIRVLSGIVLGGGIGIPTSTAIINKVYLSNRSQFIHNKLKGADSKLEIHWVGQKINQDIGKIIEGAGKVLNNSEGSNLEPTIIGIELHTSGQFNKDACEKVGFGSKEIKKEDGIGCYLSTKE